VWAVFSEEPPLAPLALAYDTDGFRCVCPGGTNGMNDCDHGARVDGSAAFVPSVFGVTAASVAVRLLVGIDVVADVERPRRPATRPSLGPRA
jgi:tRNA A37 threonylcarbamoyladenosine dehydratase